MSTTLSAQASERKLSSIDRFCTQVYQSEPMQARHLRAVASTLAIVCLVLVLCLGIAVWRANAVEQERDALVEALSAERAARIKSALAAKDVEMDVANYALDTAVRRDIVEERMASQDRRSSELEQLAEQVEREKLVKADCVTPRSILAASGL